MDVKPQNAQKGDIIVINAAVFHRSGVEGACHIEKEVEYVIFDEPGNNGALCVLTVEQEKELDDSVAGVLYTLEIDFSNGKNSIESHENVYELVNIKKE